MCSKKCGENVRQSTLPAHHEYGDIQLVANGINCVAEDQIFDAAMPVCPHDEKVWRDLARVTNDFLARVGAMPDGSFDINPHLRERVDEAVQILTSRFDFSGGR